MFVCCAMASVSPAFAQLGSTLSPRTFAGAPKTVRVDEPAIQGALLFRIYTFDDNGHLARIAQGSSRMGETLAVDFTYDKEGELIEGASSFMGNPTTKTSYSYDKEGRLIGERTVLVAKGEETSSRVMEYNEKGQIAREVLEKLRRPTEVVVREFDEGGRSIKETITIGDQLVRTIVFSYNDEGCLAKRVITMRNGREDWTTYACNDACQVQRSLRTNAMGAKKLTVFTYDAQGNIQTESRSDPEKEPLEPVVSIWSYEYPDEKNEPATEAAGSKTP